MSTKKNPTRYTTIKEVAGDFKVNEMTVRRWIADGKLTAYRLGGWIIRLDADEVDALVERIPVGTTAGYTKRGR